MALSLSLTPGCSLLAGKALSTGVSSVTSVDVSPDSIAINIGQQQLYKAKAKQILGNSTSVSPDWDTNGGVGYIDSNGLFTATNPGEGEIRATVKTLAGAAKVVGKAKVYVSPPPDDAPVVQTASVDPSTAAASSILVFKAKVSSSAGLGGVKSVVATDLATGYSAQLVDDGTHYGDEVANDGIYTGQFTIPAGITVSELNFGIHADDYNNPPHSSAWVWAKVTIGVPNN